MAIARQQRHWHDAAPFRSSPAHVALSGAHVLRPSAGTWIVSTPYVLPPRAPPDMLEFPVENHFLRNLYFGIKNITAPYAACTIVDNGILLHKYIILDTFGA